MPRVVLLRDVSAGKRNADNFPFFCIPRQFVAFTWPALPKTCTTVIEAHSSLEGFLALGVRFVFPLSPSRPLPWNELWGPVARRVDRQSRLGGMMFSIPSGYPQSLQQRNIPIPHASPFGTTGIDSYYITCFWLSMLLVISLRTSLLQ